MGISVWLAPRLCLGAVSLERGATMFTVEFLTQSQLWNSGQESVEGFYLISDPETGLIGTIAENVEVLTAEEWCGELLEMCLRDNPALKRYPWVIRSEVWLTVGKVKRLSPLKQYSPSGRHHEDYDNCNFGHYRSSGALDRALRRFGVFVEAVKRRAERRAAGDD